MLNGFFRDANTIVCHPYIGVCTAPEFVGKDKIVSKGGLKSGHGGKVCEGDMAASPGILEGIMEQVQHNLFQHLSVEPGIGQNYRVEDGEVNFFPDRPVPE